MQRSGLLYEFIDAIYVNLEWFLWKVVIIQLRSVDLRLQLILQISPQLHVPCCLSISWILGKILRSYLNYTKNYFSCCHEWHKFYLIYPPKKKKKKKSCKNFCLAWRFKLWRCRGTCCSSSIEMHFFVLDCSCLLVGWIEKKNVQGQGQFLTGML